MVKRDIDDPLFDEVSHDRFGMAFPHEWTNVAGVKMGYHGMTLRDYFAAKAMQAIIHRDDLQDHVDEFTDSVEKYVAESAYDYADAMLKQRGKF